MNDDSTESKTMNNESPQNDYRSRDIMTLRALGSFFAVMGLLVLVGTFEARGNTAALIVSLISAATLMLIGAVMLFVAQRLQRLS